MWHLMIIVSAYSDPLYGSSSSAMVSPLLVNGIGCTLRLEQLTICSIAQNFYSRKASCM